MHIQDLCGRGRLIGNYREKKPGISGTVKNFP